MNVADFLRDIKGKSRYGDQTSIADTQESQLLDSLNLKAGRVWDKGWPWNLEELAFAIVPGTARFLVSAKSGNKFSRILDLIPQDATVSPTVWGKPLEQCTRRDFYGKYAQPANPGNGQLSGQTSGPPCRYVNLGLDPAGSGLWRIEVAPLTMQNFTMAGWAVALRVPYTMADVQANNPMTFFPQDVVDDLLTTGVLSDAFHYAGNDAEAARLDSMFESKLNQKVQEQIAAAEDDTPITVPMNAELSRRYRLRNWGGTGLY